MAEPCFASGDLVWYRQVCPGGYGFANRVPAIYLKRTPMRVSIEVLKRDGSRARIAVVPANVSPRAAGEAIEWFR